MKRWCKLPSKDDIKSHKSLAFIKDHLDEPNLWHITRKSISRATLVGVFMTFMPIPFQMVFAVLIGLCIRANIFLCVVLCWISNPLTFGPMMYGCYRFGAWLLQRKPNGFPDNFSIMEIWHLLTQIWQPLVLGCVVIGGVSAIVCYILVLLTWHWIGKHHEHKEHSHD